MRVTYIELLGQQHPMCFSLTANAEIDEAFGGVEAMLDRIRSGNAAQIAEDINKYLEIVLKAGRIYASASGMDLPDPIPTVPADLLDMTDGSLLKDIFSVISKDTEREVEAVPKNGEAAPGL